MSASAESTLPLLMLGGYIAAAVYLILNPEVVGQARGWMGHGHVGTSTPGCLVRFAGCVMLAVLPGAAVGSVTHLWWAGVLLGTGSAIGAYVAVNRWRPLDD